MDGDRSSRRLRTESPGPCDKNRGTPRFRRHQSGHAGLRGTRGPDLSPDHLRLTGAHPLVGRREYRVTAARPSPRPGLRRAEESSERKMDDLPVPSGIPRNYAADPHRVRSFAVRHISPEGPSRPRAFRRPPAVLDRPSEPHAHRSLLVLLAARGVCQHRLDRLARGRDAHAPHGNRRQGRPGRERSALNARLALLGHEADLHPRSRRLHAGPVQPLPRHLPPAGGNRRLQRGDRSDEPGTRRGEQPASAAPVRVGADAGHLPDLRRKRGHPERHPLDAVGDPRGHRGLRGAGVLRRERRLPAYGFERLR